MTMSNEVRGICFDLGGTIVDDGGIPATQELGQLVGVDLATMRNYLQGAKVFREEPLRLATRMKADFESPLPVEAVVAVLESRRSSARSPRVFADAPLVVSELRRRGYLIATLSNVLGAIAPSASHETMPGLVDVAFLSCDIGVAKPAAEAFGRVQKALNLAPEQLAHVGDALSADVEGAIAAGWHAIHLTRAPTGPPLGRARHEIAPVVHDLRALLKIFPQVPAAQGVSAMR